MLPRPPVYTPFLNAKGTVSKEWSIYFQGLSTGDTGQTWTPTFTGLTGSPTITGTYYYLSDYLIYFRVQLNGTSASNTGTTYINNFPQLINQDSVIYAANSTTNIGLGTGLSDATDSRLYTPTWSVTNNLITVTGIIETRLKP